MKFSRYILVILLFSTPTMGAGNSPDETFTGLTDAETQDFHNDIVEARQELERRRTGQTPQSNVSDAELRATIDQSIEYLEAAGKPVPVTRAGQVIGTRSSDDTFIGDDPGIAAADERRRQRNEQARSSGLDETFTGLTDAETQDFHNDIVEARQELERRRTGQTPQSNVSDAELRATIDQSIEYLEAAGRPVPVTRAGQVIGTRSSDDTFIGDDPGIAAADERRRQRNEQARSSGLDETFTGLTDAETQEYHNDIVEMRQELERRRNGQTPQSNMSDAELRATIDQSIEYLEAAGRPVPVTRAGQVIGTRSSDDTHIGDDPGMAAADERRRQRNEQARSSGLDETFTGLTDAETQEYHNDIVEMRQELERRRNGQTPQSNMSDAELRSSINQSIEYLEAAGKPVPVTRAGQVIGTRTSDDTHIGDDPGIAAADERRRQRNEQARRSRAGETHYGMTAEELEDILNEPKSELERANMRKKLAKEFAPLSEADRTVMADKIQSLDIPGDQKAVMRNAVTKDAQRISALADTMGADVKKFSRALQIEGDNIKAVDLVIKENPKMQKFLRVLNKQPGGSTYKEFLHSKTGKALNLDTLLDPPEGGRSQQGVAWSMLLFSAYKSYSTQPDNKEGLKAMGLALFSTIPGVSATLHFAELDYKSAFKELACDLYPPNVLAEMAFTVLKYTEQTAYSAVKEDSWVGLAETVLKDMSDADFEESELKGYFRLKDRDFLYQFLDEAMPGLGRIAKAEALMREEIHSLMSRDQNVKNNMAAIHTLQWFEDTNVDTLLTKYRKAFDYGELKARVYEEGVPQAKSASPVERAAAKIVLDNLRIEKEYYEKLLNQFIDRIERLYNEKKQLDAGYAAIVDQAIQDLKRLYEEALPRFQDSQVAIDRLKEEYRSKLAYLTDYKNAMNKTDVEVQQEMDQLLEDFKEFIDKLSIVILLSEEQRYLDLRVHIYPGEDSQEEGNEILLGDYMRFGISARVNPIFKDIAWTIYYYAKDSSSDKLELLGERSISASAFGSESGQGRMVIISPDKKTIYQTTDDNLGDFFEERDSTIRIVPVLAFGQWSRDPVAAVGLEALKVPIDYPDLFAEDKAAFLGGESDRVTITEARVRVNAPKQVTEGQQSSMEVSVSLPAYATARNMQAQVKSSAGLSLDPDQFEVFSLSASKSAFTNLVFADSASSGKYEITVNVRILGFVEDLQPEDVTTVVQYNSLADEKEDDKQGDGQGDGRGDRQDDWQDDGDVPDSASDASIAGLLTQITSLHEQAKGKIADLKGQIKSYEQETAAYKQRAEAMRTKLSVELPSSFQTAADDPQNIFNKMKSLSEQLSRLRDKIEGFTLSVCQAYEQIKNAEGVRQADFVLSDAQSQFNEVKAAFNEANRIVSSMQALKAKISGPNTQDAGDHSSADQLIAEAMALVEEGNAIYDKGAKTQKVIHSLGDFSTQGSAIVAQAQAMINTANAHKENFSKEEKNNFKGASRTFKKIRGVERKINKTVAVSNDLVVQNGTHGMNTKSVTMGLHNSVVYFQKRAGSSPSADNSAINAEILAMYEAGMLFNAPIQEAFNSAQTCMGGIDSQHGQIASPEARIAAADCSKFPGTSAQWDTADQVVRCNCPSGFVWANNKNLCIDKKQNALASKDCSGYSNTRPKWSQSMQQVICDCVGNTKWNKSNTGCELSPGQQVAQADCSRHGPNSEPFWHASLKKAWCRCIPGYVSDANAYCVKEVAYDPGIDHGGYDDYGSEDGSYADDGYYGGDYEENQDGSSGLGEIVDTLRGVADVINGRRGDGNQGYDDSGSSSRSNCEYNFTMVIKNAYGHTTMKCNCPGWGYDPSYNRCREGFNDGISGGSGGGTSGSDGGYTGDSSGTGGSGRDGGGSRDCSQYPADFCRWHGKQTNFGVPELGGGIEYECVCGCNIKSPESKCGSTPKPRN